MFTEMMMSAGGGGNYSYNTSILSNLGTFSVSMKNGIIFALDEDYRSIWGLFVVENGEITHYVGGSSIIISITDPRASYYGYYQNGSFYLKQNSTTSYSGKLTIYYYTD